MKTALVLPEIIIVRMVPKPITSINNTNWKQFDYWTSLLMNNDILQIDKNKHAMENNINHSRSKKPVSS